MRLRFLLVTMVALLSVGVMGSAEASSTTTCTGELASGTYGKVIVRAGAVCFSQYSLMYRFRRPGHFSSKQ